MMELKKQHLFTIDSDEWSPLFTLRVLDNWVSILKNEDDEMGFGDVQEAIETFELILEALRKVQNGN